MNMKKVVRYLVVAALVILVISVPATYIWGEQTGAILRWVGLAVGVIYLLLNNKYSD